MEFLLALLLVACPAGGDTVPDLPYYGGMDTLVARQERWDHGPGSPPDRRIAPAPSVTGPVSAANPRPPASPRHDPWLAEDKLQHFFASFALTAFAYSGARAAGVDDPGALATAIATSAAAGMAKEIYDLRSQGRFSMRDMVWNAAGIAAGAVLLRETR